MWIWQSPKASRVKRSPEPGATSKYPLATFQRASTVLPRSAPRPCWAHCERSLPSKRTVASEGGAPGVAAGSYRVGVGAVGIVDVPLLTGKNGSIAIALLGGHHGSQPEGREGGQTKSAAKKWTCHMGVSYNEAGGRKADGGRMGHAGPKQAGGLSGRAHGARGPACPGAALRPLLAEERRGGGSRSRIFRRCGWLSTAATPAGTNVHLAQAPSLLALPACLLRASAPSVPSVLDFFSPFSSASPRLRVKSGIVSIMLRLKHWNSSRRTLNAAQPHLSVPRRAEKTPCRPRASPLSKTCRPQSWSWRPRQVTHWPPLP